MSERYIVSTEPVGDIPGLFDVEFTDGTTAELTTGQLGSIAFRELYEALGHTGGEKE